MKKRFFRVVVVVALLVPVAVSAQSPLDGLNVPFAATPTPAGSLPAQGVDGAITPNVNQNGPTPPPPGITDYLAYLRPDGCCGPIGGSGPICCEVAFRPGVSFPIGANVFGRTMAPGFMIQGALRSLFFNPAQDLAWTVEIGITSVWHDANRDRRYNLLDVERILRNPFTGQPVTNQEGIPVNETFPVIQVIPSSLNETTVHLALGHEIYVYGNADCGDDDLKVRVGYDAGGRWGSAKLIAPRQPFEGDGGNPNRDLPNHFNDVVGGVFFALHSDYEVPYKCAMFHAGLRTEFSYVWADLLQRQNNTDLFTINVLVNFGCRF